MCAWVIYLLVNLDKTDFMSFKPAGTISSLNSKPLKLEDTYTYLGKSISSIESDFNVHIVTWSPTERGEVGDYYYSSVFELTGQGLTVERGI